MAKVTDFNNIPQMTAALKSHTRMYRKYEKYYKKALSDINLFSGGALFGGSSTLVAAGSKYNAAKFAGVPATEVSRYVSGQGMKTVSVTAESAGKTAVHWAGKAFAAFTSMLPIITGGMTALSIYKLRGAIARAKKWRGRMQKSAQSIAKIKLQIAILERAKREGIDVGIATSEDETGLGINSKTAKLNTFLGSGGLILGALAIGVLVFASGKKKGQAA